MSGVCNPLEGFTEPWFSGKKVAYDPVTVFFHILNSYISF